MESYNSSGLEHVLEAYFVFMLFFIAVEVLVLVGVFLVGGPGSRVDGT